MSKRFRLSTLHSTQQNDPGRYTVVWPPTYDTPRPFFCPDTSMDWIGYDLHNVSPRYTASLDAAVALVERVLPSNRDDGRVWLQLLDDAVTTALASDAKPEDMARLVCFTLIRALIAKGDHNE